MLEARTFTPELETARAILLQHGAVFKGEYRCRDLIFTPIHTNKEFGDEFLRLRINEKNIWEEKDVIVVIKHVQRKEIGKDALIPLRKEFDTEVEGRKYIEENLCNDFAFDFEYTRIGWQYDLREDQIDLEKVEDLENCYTIEIKSETIEGLKRLADMLDIKSTIKGAMLGEMKRRLSHAETTPQSTPR